MIRIAVFGLGITVLFSCGTHATTNKVPYYVKRTVHDIELKSTLVEEMMKGKDSISLRQLNDVIQGKKSIEDTIRLKDSGIILLSFCWQKGSDDLIIYSTPDFVKVAAVHLNSTHSSDFYVIKDPRYKFMIDDLIRDERFVFNQMYEPPLPFPEDQ